jgi:polyisoprenoid-binding protein YceI
MLLLFQWAFILLLSVLHQEDPGPYAIRFEISNAGIVVDGYFAESSHIIRFDPNDPAASTMEGSALVKSINTGISRRDLHLQGRQYFRSDAYPEIHMRSKRISARGGNQFTGIFEIKIKDIVKEIDIPFRVEKIGNTQHYRARFSLNRLDFGLGEESIILSDEVWVTLDIANKLP